MDFEGIIKLIFIAVIVLPLFGVLLSMLGSMNCQKCEVCNYAPYQANVSDCYGIVNNLTTQLNQTPIKYVQNVTYVNVTQVVEKPVYVDRPIPIFITVISFIFSLVVTIKLFKVEIKLPKELEEELKRIEKWIKRVKWLSLIVSVLILLRLIWIFFALF